jgi:hypothetical protein
MVPRHDLKKARSASDSPQLRQLNVSCDIDIITSGTNVYLSIQPATWVRTYNMSSFLGLDKYNLSILAIPTYYILSVLPHSYAISVATQGQVSKWDNRNPRSSDLKAKLKERLPRKTFAQYERLEACHANGMEVSCWSLSAMGATS